VEDDAGSIPGRHSLFFFLKFSFACRVDLFQHHAFLVKQHEFLAGIIENYEFLPIIKRMKNVFIFASYLFTHSKFTPLKVTPVQFTVFADCRILVSMKNLIEMQITVGICLLSPY
jgi:hypothetical protein